MSQTTLSGIPIEVPSMLAQKKATPSGSTKIDLFPSTVRYLGLEGFLWFPTQTRCSSWQWLQEKKVDFLADPSMTLPAN